MQPSGRLLFVGSRVPPLYEALDGSAAEKPKPPTAKRKTEELHFAVQVAQNLCLCDYGQALKVQDCFLGKWQCSSCSASLGMRAALKIFNIIVPSASQPSSYKVNGQGT